MFKIEKAPRGDSYYLRVDDIIVGTFQIHSEEWVYSPVGYIYGDDNPNQYSFILKTLHNLNNGVSYD